MKQKPVAVGAEDVRDLQHLGIGQPLLHAVTQRVLVVLGFDDGDGDIGLVEQNVVGPLVLGPAVKLAADDNAAFGEREFLANLRSNIPARAFKRRSDELGADISFGELFFTHIHKRS